MKSLPKFQSGVASILILGFILILAFLAILYFGTSNNLDRFGLFGQKKQTEQPAHAVQGRGPAKAAPQISVTASPFGSSHFTTTGCGFKANSSDYAVVILGPGLYTTSLTSWVNAFITDASGCGTTVTSWTNSGVTGSFDVYVVSAPNSNPYPHFSQPISNVVTMVVSSLD